MITILSATLKITKPAHDAKMGILRETRQMARDHAAKAFGWDPEYIRTDVIRVDATTADIAVSVAS